MPPLAALRPPRALDSGSHMVVIAPSSPFDVAAFEAGVALLRDRYRVSHRPDVTAREGFVAGDDARRVAELQAAIDDDSVDAIIAARGGYGATRLLDRLDLSRLRERPKLLVGFSDVTALHAQWARAGVRSVHGPMVATLGKRGAGAVDELCRVLAGAVPPQVAGLTCMHPGRAQGVLLGGNLTVLTALIGTPFMPSLAGAVLFLEDVAERPYRIDRMLTTWRQARALEGVAAVVVGAFSDCDAGPDGVSVYDVLSAQLRSLGVPVLWGVSAGHVEDNRPLPLGALVDVDASAGVLTMLGGVCEPG